MPDTMIALFLLAVATSAYAAESRKHCLKNENMELLNGNNEISKEAKCYIACLYNCTDLVSENGDIIFERVSLALESVHLDTNAVLEMNKTLHDCIDQAQKMKDDPCELGYQSATCLEKPVNMYIKKLLTISELTPLHDAIIKSSKESGLYLSLAALSLVGTGKCALINRPM